MSTIASPRDPSTPTPGSAGARRSQPPPPLGLGGLGSPTGSARPSLDTPPPRRSASLSPGPGGGTTRTQPTAGAARSNRAALREFYNIKSRPSSGVGLGIGGGESGAQTPTLEVTDELGAVTGAPWYSFSEVPVWPEVDVGSGQQQQGRKKDGSQVESSSFDADAFVNRALAELGLDGLLRLYARVLGEIRALDAEKKALVYDNYSKLISATETIRKVGATVLHGLYLQTLVLNVVPDEGKYGSSEPDGVDTRPCDRKDLRTGSLDPRRHAQVGGAGRRRGTADRRGCHGCRYQAENQATGDRGTGNACTLAEACAGGKVR